MTRAPVLAAALCLALAGCRTLPDAAPLPPDDPRPARLLADWAARSAGRQALRAVARLAVEAPDAAADGGDLSLRSKQRLWLARPAQLRVEILGLFDAAVAVLATDGREYALLQAPDGRVERGPVYDGLLWDAARLDLTPAEIVDVMLGAAPGRDELVLATASEHGDLVRLELADAAGRVQRVAEFGVAGELRRLEQRDASGRRLWEARYDDFTEVGDGLFAREVALHSPAARARIVLRDVDLDPTLSEELFRVSP